MRRLATFVLLLFVVGCGGDTADPEPAQPRAKREAKREAKQRAEPAATEAPSGPTTEFVTLTDPVEDAFTVDVPKGWDTKAYSTGDFDVHREVVTSVSPDGETVLFLGDPKIPNYWNPATANPITVQMVEMTEYMELESYRPAGEYFPQYADEKFGELPGFEITSFADNQKVVDSLSQQFADAGLTVNINAIEINFGYEQEDGTPVNGLLVGVTVDGGDFWNADVTGLSTTGKVADYRPMLEQMAASKKTNPEYTARANAEHQRRMAQIQAGTAAMTQRHDANMSAIQAAGAASTAAFEDRMSAMDANQQQFLNYINEEDTVAAPSGGNVQVQTGYERYWVKPDGSYIGGDVNFDDQALRRMGLNPDDFEEARFVR